MHDQQSKLQPSYKKPSLCSGPNASGRLPLKSFELMSLKGKIDSEVKSSEQTHTLLDAQLNEGIRMIHRSQPCISRRETQIESRETCKGVEAGGT